MLSKTPFSSAILAVILLSGCASTSQPSINSKMDTTASSLKEYIAQKRVDDAVNYSVIAERQDQTLIEFRTYDERFADATSRDVMEVLDDLKGYCQSINGRGVYGDQAINTLKAFPTLLSIDYVAYKREIREQGVGYFAGFYKCASPKDGFEVVMKDEVEPRQSNILGNKRDAKQTYSRYYLVSHEKPQTLGQKTWLNNQKYANFANQYPLIEGVLGVGGGNSNVIPWRYERITGAQKYCTYHGGEFFVSNPMTKFKDMSMDEYLLTRMDELKNTSSINVFMDNETFTCKNPQDKKHDFILIHSGKNIEFKRWN